MTATGPGRYLLTLNLAGRTAMRGWWSDEATARDKFREWVGSRGGQGVRVVLVDEATGQTLDEWPAAVSSASSSRAGRSS